MGNLFIASIVFDGHKNAYKTKSCRAQLVSQLYLDLQRLHMPLAFALSPQFMIQINRI